jgi:methionine-rich copper-binding protein CopC
MKAGLASYESERLAVAGLSDESEHRGAAAPPGLTADLPAGLPVRRISLSGRWSSLRLPRMPATTNWVAAALLFVVTGTTVAWRLESPASIAPVATVKLIALRGGDEDAARAPAGRPLELLFNRTDLAEDLSYRAEVVDSSGHQMWTGNTRIADQSLSIQVNRPLRAGAYWVRLYTSAGQLLREFGLRVE